MAAVVLFALLAAQASAVLGEVLSIAHTTAEMGHAEGSGSDSGSESGSGSGDEGGPCGPSCPCACCPGHSVIKAVPPLATELPVAPPRVLHVLALADAHPAEVVVAIFHPPRA